MATNRSINIGPIALTSVLGTNILNCALAALGGPVGFAMQQPYLLLKHIRIINRTNVAATVSLWKGIAAGNVAGTEFIWAQKTVPAFDGIEEIGLYRFDAADFLVGGSNQANALTFYAEGELGVSG